MKIEVSVSLNEGLYLKEPQGSELGRNIIKSSIEMIDEFGLESFTFRKLAAKIKSTEASVYRYFENKHMLLLYLNNWYWSWVLFLIQYNTNNIKDPREQLKIIVQSIVSASEENPSVEYVNEHKLHNILIEQGGKAYHTKNVDQEHSMGFYSSYQELVSVIACVIGKINPDFEYPLTLATNLFEMSNNHIFFARHLPLLTDVNVEQNDVYEVERMLNYFTDKLLS